jgi:hypothetical protein
VLPQAKAIWPVEPAEIGAGQSTHAYSSLEIGNCQGSDRQMLANLPEILPAGEFFFVGYPTGAMDVWPASGGRGENWWAKTRVFAQVPAQVTA